MDQYHPDYQAHRYDELKFPLYPNDYQTVVNHAIKLGLTRGLERCKYL